MYTNEHHPTQFGIHLKVSDISKSLEFYQSLGFIPVFSYGIDSFLAKIEDSVGKAPETYNGVVFAVDNALFEIADGHMAVKPEVFEKHISSSKISAMVYVESIHAVVENCSRHNIPLLVEPKEFPWGTKEVVIKDPDGFILVFIQRINTT